MTPEKPQSSVPAQAGSESEKPRKLFTDPYWQNAASAAKVSGKLRRLSLMHALHGTSPGHTCGDCAFLIAHRFSRAYFKCSKSKVTHGPATDWRSGWAACGLFQPARDKPTAQTGPTK